MEQTIYTMTAKCRDCYRCLRSCPVGAIGVRNGQAYIDSDRCILCGTCIRECPQKAKTFRNDIATVRAMIEAGDTVVASVAPSYAGVYGGWKANRVPSALRSLGFSYVTETSEGAYYVAQESKKLAEKAGGAGICTACPAIVNYIEKYRPHLVSQLIPVVSPMIAHARILRERMGKDCKLVFIGPCVAKKQEAQRPEHAGLIDAVLTFRELEEWMAKENVVLSRCEESSFDGVTFPNTARLFPVPGGLLKTAGIDNDGTILDVFHTSGAANVRDLFDLPERDWKFEIIEPLFCQEGCINGPGLSEGDSIITRRSNLIKHVNKVKALPKSIPELKVDLKTTYSPDEHIEEKEITEDEIQEIFELTGKTDPEFQLNCGACGYHSCRENAEAVIRGMAEPDMCMPYMRRMAEQRTDKIIETSPNGIVILDEDLTIVGMNPAFQKFFLCTNGVLGKRISYIMDASGFEKLVSGSVDRFESIIKFDNSEFHQLLYSLKAEHQYIGIYVDITGIQLSQKKVDSIKLKTVLQAQELLEHQIHMAQNIATFLGESTAKSEELVERLMSVYEAEE